MFYLQLFILITHLTAQGTETQTQGLSPNTKGRWGVPLSSPSTPGLKHPRAETQEQQS